MSSAECYLHGSDPHLTADFCGQVKQSNFWPMSSLLEIDLTCYETLYDDEPAENALYCNSSSTDCRANTTAGANMDTDIWLCSFQDVQPSVLNEGGLEQAVQLLEPHYEQQQLANFCSSTSDYEDNNEQPAYRQAAECQDLESLEKILSDRIMDSCDNYNVNCRFVRDRTVAVAAAAVESEQEVPNIILEIETDLKNSTKGPEQIESTSNSSLLHGSSCASLFTTVECSINSHDAQSTLEETSTLELANASRSVKSGSQSSVYSDDDQQTSETSSQHTDSENSQSPTRRISNSCMLSMPSGLGYELIEE